MFELFSRYLQDNSTDSNFTDPCEDIDTEQDIGYQVAINILVFFTVWGISSVVDISEFKASFSKPPIYAGAAFQFLLMPFIGFITVVIFPLDSLSAIALLILCASPGGSFSNWWCNLFNADLALSVSMTSLSTVASLAFLPLNSLIYITLAYERTQGTDEDDVDIDFGDLALTLGVVITAVILGLLTGAYFPQYQSITNIIGNVAGAGSILLGVVASTDTCDEDDNVFNQDIYPLWIATAFPLIIGLVGVLFMTSLLGLPKPQRVAIALETAYQNTGISLAYTLGQGDAGLVAAAVPVIYGGYEALFFGIFMLVSWKLGWTYAPPGENMFKVMFQNYQPHGDNHKKLFPGYYNLKDEADEFNKSFREGVEKITRRFSSTRDEEEKKEVEEGKEKEKEEEKVESKGEAEKKEEVEVEGETNASL